MILPLFIYTKFILSLVYIVGFYRHLPFYYSQLGHFKLNMIIFGENCFYAALAFGLLFMAIEKKPIYKKMLQMVGLYCLASFAFFALYMFNHTLSAVEYSTVLAAQTLNLLIAARMYIFKPKENQKKLKRRGVAVTQESIKTSPFAFYDDLQLEKMNLTPSNLAGENFSTSSRMQDEVLYEVNSPSSLGREVQKIKNVSGQKAKFKRLKKFDLKKV